MTVVQFITQLIGRQDNVTASDSENATRRARYLEWLTEAVEEFRGEREWPWIRGESTAISVTAANAYASLPSDFDTIGDSGTVVDVATGQPLDWVPPDDIIEARRSLSGGAVPEVYSVFDVDTTTGYQLIQFPPLSANISVRVSYLKAAPPLDESGNSDKLKVAVQAHYHQPILVPLVRHKTQMSKGDSRSTEFYELYRKNFARAIRREFPAGKESQRGLRSFFGA